jgi:hypothetical protein
VVEVKNIAVNPIAIAVVWCIAMAFRRELGPRSRGRHWFSFMKHN